MIRSVREGTAEGGEQTLLAWRVWEAVEPRGNLLLIHGLGEHSGRYRPVAEALSEVGISVFAFDLRGHGRSEGPRGDLGAFPRFLEDLLIMEEVMGRETPAGLPRFLLGHSLGGLIALERLRTLGEGYRGAVFSAPWLRAAQPAWFRALGRSFGWLFPRIQLRAAIDPQRLTRDPEMAAAWQEDPLIHTRITGGLFREAERVQRTLLQEGPPKGVPMLFLIPGADPVVSSEVTLEFAKAIVEDGSRVEILEGRRHEPFNDLGRGEVFRILTGWLVGLMGSLGDRSG